MAVTYGGAVWRVGGVSLFMCRLAVAGVENHPTRDLRSALAGFLLGPAILLSAVPHAAGAESPRRQRVVANTAVTNGET